MNNSNCIFRLLKMATKNKEMLFTGGYSSDFDDQVPKSTWKTDELAQSGNAHFSRHGTQIPAKTFFSESCEKEERKSHMYHFLAMDAYSRHKKLVNDYLRYYGGSIEQFKRSDVNDKTDYDVIRENHRFIWEEEDTVSDSWEKTLAKKYYDKLFKEYCISDLSRYKENKFAMRWRIEKEVIDGKGQFTCGNKRCDERDKLQSWEVNFGYQEHGAKRNAFVKLRLCPDCSKKLNFHQKRKAVVRKRKCNDESSQKKKKKHKKEKKKKKKRRRKYSSSSEEDSSESDSQGAAGDEIDSEYRESEANNDKETSADEGQAIWSRPVKQAIEKSREEELDDYLEDLFL